MLIDTVQSYVLEAEVLSVKSMWVCMDWSQVPWTPKASFPPQVHFPLGILLISASLSIIIKGEDKGPSTVKKCSAPNLDTWLSPLQLK